MLKKVGLFILLCILVIFLIYLVNPEFVEIFTNIIPSTDFQIMGDFTLQSLIKIIGVIVATFISAKIISMLLRKLFDETPFPEKIENTIISLSKYVIYLIGFFILLAVIGLDLTSLVVGIGAFSIAISFATKDIIQNLVSGVILYADRPFKVGDNIRVKKLGGTVKKISIRSTTLKEADGDYVIVPNTVLVTNPVKRYRKGKKFNKK